MKRCALGVTRGVCVLPPTASGKSDRLGLPGPAAEAAGRQDDQPAPVPAEDGHEGALEASVCLAIPHAGRPGEAGTTGRIAF